MLSRSRDHWQRSTRDQQQGECCPENGGQHATDKQHTFGRAVPSIKRQTGGSSHIKAMAAKLARLVYRMLRYGMQYADQGAKTYDEQPRKLQINHIKWKAGPTV